MRTHVPRSPRPVRRRRGARSGPDAPREVLVLGAGVAGLVAARRLEAAGVRTLVLEATGRVGGRVRTARDFTDGSVAELGGELLEERHAELFRLLGDLGLRTTRVLAHGFRFWGTPASPEDAWERLLQDLAPERKAFERAGRSWRSEAAVRLASTDVETWMRERRFPPGRRHRWRSVVRGLFAGDPRRLSLLPLVAELTGEGAGGLGAFHRVVGGTDLVASELAKRLERPPLLHAVVVRVERGEAGVTVKARVRGRLRSFPAAAAVVALPVPPLRDVEFDPPLSESMRRALDTIGFGRATKTVLRFRERVVILPGCAWGSDLDVGAFWDAGEGQPGERRLLSVTTGGEPALALGRRSERARVRWVAQHQLLVPPADLVEGRSVAWDREPFAGGGYACFDVGFDPRLRDALRLPSGPLSFAGEHTSADFQGYVNGAVESGRRAADETLDFLSGRRR